VADPDDDRARQAHPAAAPGEVDRVAVQQGSDGPASRDDAEARDAETSDDVETREDAEAGVADLLRENLSDRNSIIDTSLPTVAFLIAYLVTGSQLRPSLVAAVAAGLLVAVLRAVRRESVRHIFSGFLGVAIAAWLANRTGRAEDFFLPGLLLNLGYGAAFAISAAVRQPLVGLGIRLMTGDGGAWRDFEPLRRAAYRATWMWAALFAVRVVVQLPLYLGGFVAALGVAKLVLGFPLFLLGAFATHRLLSPALAERRARTESGSLP
jgi:hypothetical protein